MKYPNIFSYLLYRIYSIRSPRLRNLIERIILKLEHGEMYSKTIRRIYQKYYKIEIGMYSYGGCFEKNNIRPYTIIGRYCSFASSVCIYNANHPMNFKSTHPFFYSPDYGYVENERISRNHIEIGNDVWIGRNVIILSGVGRIGDGAVIGAGSVVTKEVPDFAIVAGNPARIIRHRFDDDTINKLKKERWWDKDINELKDNIKDYINPYIGSTTKEFRENNISEKQTTSK